MILSVFFPQFDGVLNVEFRSLFGGRGRRGALTGSRRFKSFVIGERNLKGVEFLDLLAHEVINFLNINSNYKYSQTLIHNYISKAMGVFQKW